MMVRKAVAGSVLGVVLTAIAISGAGSAFAEGGHGAPGTPGSTETTNINSFNTKTVTVTKDDHSVNLALFSGNTVTLRVFNNNFNNNKLFSGNKTPILNGLKMLSGNKNTFPIITPPSA